MGSKKKQRKDEARIREAMAALVSAARKRGEIAHADEPEGPEVDERHGPRRRTRGPQKAPTKEPVSIRLDRDVVAHLRKSGRGWQTRLNAMLREALSLETNAPE